MKVPSPLPYARIMVTVGQSQCDDIKILSHVSVFVSMSVCLLGPELIFVTGLVKFVTAVARLVCLDLFG